jgi:hypothetical protein
MIYYAIYGIKAYRLQELLQNSQNSRNTFISKSRRSVSLNFHMQWSSVVREVRISRVQQFLLFGTITSRPASQNVDVTFELLRDVLQGCSTRPKHFANIIELKTERTRFCFLIRLTRGWRNVGIRTFRISLIGASTSTSNHSGSIRFSRRSTSEKQFDD